MRAPFRSHLFQGSDRPRDRRYFEGWYFKHAQPGSGRVTAIIPGVAFGNDPHRFIQINDSEFGSDYVRFDLADGRFERDELGLQVGRSVFLESGIDVDLPSRLGHVRGELRYGPMHRPRRTLWRPGIMGPFSYIPAMECYHGLVSTHHDVSGTLTIGETRVDLSGGAGYIEKDWGASFPRAWIWMQANSFADGASFMLSHAHIPWGRLTFPGHLGFFMHPVHAPHGVIFGTYTRRRIGEIAVDRRGEEIIVTGTITGPADRRAGHKPGTRGAGHDTRVGTRLRTWTCSFRAHYRQGSELIAPANGDMVRSLKESVSGTIDVRVLHDDTLVWEGSSPGAGVEVQGDVEGLLL